MTDPTKLKAVKTIDRPDILFCVARPSASGRLFVGSSDFKVYDVDTTAEKPQAVALAGHQSYVTGLASAGNHVVSGSYDGRLIWWNAETRAQVRAVDAHAKWIRNVVASPDGMLIASVADDMRCRVWEAETGKLIHTLDDHAKLTPQHYPSMLYAVTVSPDGKYLATGDKTGHVAIWELATGKKVGAVEAPVMYTWDPKQRRHSIGGIRSLAFSSDNKLLAAGGIGTIGNVDHLGGPARVEVFDWQAGKRTHELFEEKVKGLIEQMVFHPNGDWLFCVGGDHAGFFKFYDLKEGKVLHQDKAPMHVHGFAINQAHDAIYAVGHRKIVLWDLKGESAA